MNRSIEDRIRRISVYCIGYTQLWRVCRLALNFETIVLTHQACLKPPPKRFSIEGDFIGSGVSFLTKGSDLSIYTDTSCGDKFFAGATRALSRLRQIFCNLSGIEVKS